MIIRNLKSRDKRLETET